MNIFSQPQHESRSKHLLRYANDYRWQPILEGGVGWSTLRGQVSFK